MYLWRCTSLLNSVSSLLLISLTSWVRASPRQIRQIEVYFQHHHPILIGTPPPYNDPRCFSLQSNSICCPSQSKPALQKGDDQIFHTQTGGAQLELNIKVTFLKFIYLFVCLKYTKAQAPAHPHPWPTAWASDVVYQYVVNKTNRATLPVIPTRSQSHKS